MTSKARQLSHLLSVVLIGGLSTVVACSSGGGGDSTGGSSTGGSATGGKTGGSGGTGGTATGGSSVTGGKGGGTATGGTATGGGSVTGGKGGGSATGGSATGGGNVTGGSGGGAATGGSGPGGSSGCTNTDTSSINIDASGFICNNQWGIKGAWYCYSSDTSSPCHPEGVIPYNTTSKGMCLSGTIANGGYDGLGFKVNSGPPGGKDTPGTWDGSKIVGFAITLTAGASGKGTGNSVVGLQFVTPNDVVSQSNQDAPGVTLPGVAGTSVTYNVLYSDAVLRNNSTLSKSVDANNLTDVKLIVPPDTGTVAYDFCITKVVPLMTAPSPLVATGSYGPPWSNQLGEAVNGVNGYAVQSAPFSTSGFPMTMQVSATASGVGFKYTAKSGGGGNMPAAFPAVISGWGPGVAGYQFYGPYKGGKTIGQLTSVKSSWTYTMGASGDAAYDVWFGNSAHPVKPQTELMIWIGNKDKDPLKDKGMGSGGAVGGRTPFLASDNGTGQQVVSYWVDKGTVGTASDLNLLQYFQDAASHGYGGVSTGSFLLGVQTGFEVYSGDTWTTTDYSITIQ